MEGVKLWFLLRTQRRNDIFINDDMFLFLTTPGPGYTVGEIIHPPPGSNIPHCKVTTYDAVLQSSHTAEALHVFTDLERLSESELITAAGLYRTLCDAGIPCLNDPARVMHRYQLLCNLFEEGINPFTAYRAEKLCSFHHGLFDNCALSGLTTVCTRKIAERAVSSVEEVSDPRQCG